MANIRIKDLANTASSTASDDFIGIDGATNGTRKLNAYSPSFGGNATVAGTLTVNGTGLSAFAGNVETVGAAASDRFFQTVASGTLATAIGQNTSGSTNAFGIASGNSYVGNAQNYGLAFSTNAVTRMTISNGSTGGNVSISSTTASTSTSTGALVVSGGVGVAGASWFGSTLVTVGTLWNSGSSNISTNGFNDATNIASNVITLYGSTGSTNIQKAGKITTFDGGSGYYGLSLQAPTSAYPNFSGAVNFTEVLTLTSQNATFAGTLTVSGNTNAFGAGGTGGANSQLILEGGSAANGGGAILYRKNGTVKAYAGMQSSILGGGSTSDNYIIYTSSGLALTVAGQQVQANATTASTSTSTGALVVSGGVGVAGAIYAGGVIGMAGDTRYGVAKVYNSSTGDMFGLEQVSGAQTGDVPATRVFTSSAANSALDLGKYTSATAFTNWLRIGTNGNVLVNTTTDAGQKLQVSGTAAFSGAISIGNTVNTVSPTSPNRTITIVIGGTTYYIHAKTTND